MWLTIDHCLCYFLAWYDAQMSKYQRDRQDTELEKVFEEKLTPGGTESEVWRTAELGDDERVKIREHKVSQSLIVV